MEVEFLSNIRYDLFSSEEEWTHWHTKLGLFGDYFNAASVLPVESEPPVLRISPPRLQPTSPSSKLPSPPGESYRAPSQPNWYAPPPALPYPVSQMGEVAPTGPRKRSREDDTELQPMKRISRPTTSSSTPVSLGLPSNVINPVPTLPPVLTPTPAGLSLLPPPNFPPTSNPMTQSISSSASSQLPIPSMMPSAYGRAPNWSQQMPPASLPPVASTMYNHSNLPDLGRHSQTSYTPSTVSPAVSAYSTHTPQTHLSPSFFLANRNSPYRPVRSVHTLLIPPPSTSMQQQRSVPFDHMHYQPLSKGSVDRKTGLLPYIPSDPWYQSQVTQPFYTPSQNFSG